MFVEVTPAYGRDYTRKADAITDWKEGKDFVMAATQQYCSIRDAQREGWTVIIRYGNLRKVTSVPK